MHKSLFRWRLGATVLIICLMLAFNSVVILAQDATDVPPTASAEPTETETPLPIPTDIPTDSPPVEEPTLTPTEEVVVPSETPVATETLPPEATEVATEEVTEVPPAETTAEVPPTEATAETPTVVAPVTEEPPLSLLVRELFDNGDFSPWLAGAGWSLAASESGLALQVVNSNDPIVLQKGAFYNLAVQTRFLWATGSAQISVRQTAVGNYTASINANGLVTLKRAGESVASSVVAPVPAGTWRTLRLSAINDVIRVSVDDVGVITYSDIAPLPPGEVSLSADFNPAPGDVNPTPEIQTLLADDFFLWVPLAELGLYPAPTPIAPVIVPPTEPPPAEVSTEVPTEVVVEPTAEPTEVVVEPTAEPTEVVTETPAGPVELSGPYDDLTQAVGKDVSIAAPPSAEELVSAQDAQYDNFADRLAVTLNGSGFFVHSDGTVLATLEGSEPVPVCGGIAMDNTVWYTFTPATTGTYTFSTAGSSFDTVLAVYTDTTLAGLDPYGCNDDASAALISSQIALPLTSGVAYQIQIGGYNGRYGTYTFRVQQGAVPAALAAPVLVAPSPATGTNSNLTTPAFTWNKVANANSYEVQVATNATFTIGLQSAIVPSGACGLTTCPYTVSPALTTPATYYWRVRGRNLNDVNGPFSLVRTFIYRTAPPTLSLPAANAAVTNARPPLSWVAYPGATYTIEIADNLAFTGAQSHSPGNLLTSFTPPVALAPGDWYWRVRALPALNNGGPTVFSTERKFTVNLMSLPANNATTADTTPLFSWLTATAVSPTPATQYRLEIDRAITFNSNGGNPDYAVEDLTTLNHTLPAALTAVNPSGYGAYYWRVLISTNGLGTNYVISQTNPPYRRLFISPSVPAAPVLTNPPIGAFTNDTQPLLDWNPTTTATGGPFSYDVQVCANATCTTTIYDSANVLPLVPADDTDYEVSIPLAPGLYYWRVRTVNDFDLASAYSAARTFTVRTNILSAPADSSTTIDTTPLFSWLAINYPAATPPPVKYELQVDSSITFNSNGGNPDYVATDLTVLSHTLPAPSALTVGTWYWRVLISFDGGTVYNVPGAPGDYRTLYVSTIIPAAPVLQFPTNNGTTGDTTPTLQWKGSTSATGGPFAYQVQVSTVNTFATTVYVNNNVPAGGCTPTTPLCSDTVGGALSNGTYYWRVRTLTTLGAPGAYSAVFKFIVNAPNPAIPTQNLPANNAITNLVRPTLTWLATPNANRYHIVVNDTNDCTTTPIVNFTTATPVLSQALTPAVMLTPLAQGEYYWCVEALDAALFGSGFQASPRRFAVNLSNAPADNANIVAPAAGARPTFSWLTSGLPAGTTYQLKVSTNPDMTGQVYLGPVQTTLSHAIPAASPALPYDQYYWQVAVNGVFPVPAIVKRTFIVTPTLPGAPVLTAPATGSSSSTMPLLDWNAVTIPAGATWTVDHYEVQIATNAAFTLNLQSFDAGTATQYQVVGPLTQGTYYWRVRAYNNFLAPGGFSLVRNFIIDGTSTGVPSLTAPADNSSSTVKNPNFTWTRPTGAVRFEIRYSSNYPASYSPGDQLNTIGTVSITSLTATTLLTGTSYKPPSPLIPGTYYWQVRAFDAAGNPSGWTNLRTFKINSATTDTPQPNRFGPSDPILLTWGPLSWVTDGTPGNGYYEVQIDDNSNFSSPAFQRTNAGGNPIYYDEYVNANSYGVVIPAGSLPAGLPNGTWYWRVRGFNPTVAPSGAYGAYSTMGTFVVDK